MMIGIFFRNRVIIELQKTSFTLLGYTR